MANVWSHYLNKRRCPRSLLALLTCSGSSLVSALLGEAAPLAAGTKRSRRRGSIDVCTPTGTKPAPFAFYSEPVLVSVFQFHSYAGLAK